VVDVRLCADRPLGVGAGGWLASMGALDFAGGTVVHINAGATPAQEHAGLDVTQHGEQIA
jgi:ammonia channel protein AmtB